MQDKSCLAKAVWSEYPTCLVLLVNAQNRSKRHGGGGAVRVRNMLLKYWSQGIYTHHV